MPGSDVTGGVLREIGVVPAPVGGKPEGLAVIAESAESYELLVVYDGPPNGAPRRLRVDKH